MFLMSCWIIRKQVGHNWSGESVGPSYTELIYLKGFACAVRSFGASVSGEHRHWQECIYVFLSSWLCKIREIKVYCVIQEKFFYTRCCNFITSFWVPPLFRLPLSFLQQILVSSCPAFLDSVASLWVVCQWGIHLLIADIIPSGGTSCTACAAGSYLPIQGDLCRVLHRNRNRCCIIPFES